MNLLIELYIPLIISNIVHMVIVKANYLSVLRKPINTKLFGANKTYRGLLVICILNALLQLGLNSFLYQTWAFADFGLGMVLGLAYILSELPNSFVKRRMGIPAGGKAHQGKLLFMIMDKSDSALGVSLTFVLIKNLAIFEFFKLFFIAFILHTFISVIFVRARLKESF
jgi:hypothetical protein